MSRFVLFLAGVLFAVGLGLAGMTQPANVQGFLDVTGHWNPSLMLVMGGALATFALLARLVERQPRPRFATRFPPGPPRGEHLRLVGGAALFGVGWALSGYCPGPAIVSLGGGSAPAVVFVAAMSVGMVLARQMDHVSVRRPSTDVEAVADRRAA